MRLTKEKQKMRECEMGIKQLRFSYQLPQQKERIVQLTKNTTTLNTYIHTIQLATKDYNFFKKKVKSKTWVQFLRCYFALVNKSHG